MFLYYPPFVLGIYPAVATLGMVDVLFLFKVVFAYLCSTSFGHLGGVGSIHSLAAAYIILANCGLVTKAKLPPFCGGEIVI